MPDLSIATRDEFKGALIDFINGPLFNRHGKLTRPMRIEATTPLFAAGIIDSLGILDLLAFVETATSRPIPARKVDMKYFGTIERICQSFWSDAEGHS
jgi:acyl carrier protein